jgi:hypothetical protein
MRKSIVGIASILAKSLQTLDLVLSGDTVLLASEKYPKRTAFLVWYTGQISRIFSSDAVKKSI